MKRIHRLNETEWRILGLLCETDLALTPQVVAHNLDLSRHYCNTRLIRLRCGGLVNREERGLYRINRVGAAVRNETASAAVVESVTTSLERYDEQADEDAGTMSDGCGGLSPD